jgi:formylglycine-generating enzyme required for sulfatase activity
LTHYKIMNARNILRSVIAIGAIFLSTQPSAATPPVVSNIRAAQRAGTHLVDIYYNVSDAEGNSPLTVYVAISANGGLNFNVPVFTLTGAVGPGVALGNDRHITWNAGTDWPGQFNSQCKVKIIADDGTAPPAPAGMAYIPALPFQMGDTFLENTASMPVHSVYVSRFFMDKFDVTREQWLDVYTWAIGNGYAFDNGGSFYGNNHPVHTVNWYDAVKWSNARSEKEGLTPCYYTDASQSAVYRSGQLGISNACVKWSATGYRLPTEAEWEKAARGGAAARRFPWGDTISRSQANYYGQPGGYDLGPAGYLNATTPVNAYAPNGYGLYDMAGNVWQWCWDVYDQNWYGQPAASSDDPHGPPTPASGRVLRGGAWFISANYSQCAYRNDNDPVSANGYFGFRCVRGG